MVVADGSVVPPVVATVVVVAPEGSGVPATVVVVGRSTTAGCVGRPSGRGVGSAPAKPAAITRIPATRALPATANPVASWRRRSPFARRNSPHRRPSAPCRTGSSTYL